MKSKVFCVFDTKAGVYHPPFLTHNRATAMRMLTNVVGDRNHAFSQHPHDYHLFELGEFEDSSGAFDVHAPEQVCMLAELLTKED